LQHATGVEPMATGKPDPTMHAETVERTGAQRPLVVGDRLDTDIEGAGRVGCASLLVFSGVTTPRELLAAPENQRPDYLADDVSGVLESHPAVVVDGDVARCGRWSVRVDGGQLVLSTGDSADGGDNGDVPTGAEGGAGFGADALDALRACCWHAWSAGSASSSAASSSSSSASSASQLMAGDSPARGADGPARTVLERLGLTG